MYSPSNQVRIFLKWCTKLNREIINRGISKNREALKEIINNLRHHRNPNQNDSEILTKLSEWLR
jgi:DNA-binding transcriptional regulator GbsR (MarR family)